MARTRHRPAGSSPSKTCSTIQDSAYSSATSGRCPSAVWSQLDRLNSQLDKLYVHIDMDVLDPREVSMQGNKVSGGPSSEELATLFERIFARYPKATSIGFATIPPSDPGGLSIAALNRMIVGAIDGSRKGGGGGDQYVRKSDHLRLVARGGP